MTRANFLPVRSVLCSSMLMLAACSSSPVVNDGQGPELASDASTAQEVAEAAGLGTVDYVDNNRSTCKKRRQTGSGIRRSSCGRYLESRPIRSVTRDDPALLGSGVGVSSGPND
ncbi:MAG: hypothetical protein R3192_06100 [Woeseiaceae bacterium]|nr:hypothetical protein [Woeseiaceae bacterium]